MRLARYQVETSVLRLHALRYPSLRLLKVDGCLYGDPFDLFVPYDGAKLFCSALGVREHPGRADVLDIANGALAFPLQLRQSPFKPGVQLVQPFLALLHASGKPRRRA